MLIFESLEDIDQILGKQFYECLNNLKISFNTIEELNNAKKRLSIIKKEHLDSLKNIRTIIAAHRDHNFLLQLETMENLNPISF